MTRYAGGVWPWLLCALCGACGEDSTSVDSSADGGQGGSAGSGNGAGDSGSDAGPDASVPEPCDAFEVNRTVGTTRCSAGAQPGYTLFSPIGSPTTYLIDLDGRVVHSWEHSRPPGQVVYLLEDGRLLRTTDPGQGSISGGGQGGGVELVAWDGSVEWSFEYFSDTVRAHHDVEMLPGGNIVMIAWERLSVADARTAGRRATLGAGEIWPDHLIEVRPEANGGASIVWQWHAWDHVVQANDSSLPSYGQPAEYPQRMDIDFGADRAADWLHINAVDYDAAHDQLILSVHNTSEVWFIDHGTTTEEAAGGAGDILYRWGNPSAWGGGAAQDRVFYSQHDTHLIPSGLPGAGELLLFNNGDMRNRAYSSVDQLLIPRGVDGSFVPLAGAFSASTASWSYSDGRDFFSDHVGGAQRLSTGNTLVCEGALGRLFEVTASGERVWQYQVPVGRAGVLTQGQQAESSGVFRAYRYDASYPGLSGRDLTPGAVIELPQ
ncbi:MAG: aryl-sulfate sulfotransferase [Polyangiaceae bacterium]